MSGMCYLYWEYVGNAMAHKQALYYYVLEYRIQLQAVDDLVYLDNDKTKDGHNTQRWHI